MFRNMYAKIIGSFSLGTALLLAALQASAVVIEYELDALGGDRYQYNYTITNDDIAFGVEEFAIYFDYSLYDNLAIEASPADWDSIIFQPDLGLPDDGLFDSLAWGLPLGLGETLSGFSVSFDWLGGGSSLPSEQFFDVFDPFTFDIIGGGITTLIPSTTPVPSPNVLAIFILGLIAARRIKA